MCDEVLVSFSLCIIAFINYELGSKWIIESHGLRERSSLKI